MTPILNVRALKCYRCGHVWLSKKYLEDGKTKPIACAKCKSAYWNLEAEPVNKKKGRGKGKKDKK